MCRCLDCQWIKKESLTCTAPGYRSRPQLTPKRVWRTRTCRHFSPKLYCIAGKMFLQWLEKAFPAVSFEDWSAPCRTYLEIKLGEMGFKVSKKLIHSHLALHPEWNIRPQDYRLLDGSGKHICWVDVRYAEKMKNGCYSLEEKKYREFLLISEDSKLPTYLVIYAGGDFDRFWWTKLDNGSDPSKLHCEKDISFSAEIVRLIHSHDFGLLPRSEKTLQF